MNDRNRQVQIVTSQSQAKDETVSPLTRLSNTWASRLAPCATGLAQDLIPSQNVVSSDTTVIVSTNTSLQSHAVVGGTFKN
ncbi:MAG: hypothetical protein H6822_24085 [Planctomycetaceae bacterium]|nr:hypothetical protein [Planctomycetaceae bacterium]